MKFPRSSSALYGMPWAIRPAKLQEIALAFELRKAGAKDLHARLSALAPKETEGRGRAYRIDGKVAIVPVIGTLHKRVGFFEAMSGGVGAESIDRAVKGALADSAVEAIVLEIDSPGGSVFGPDVVAETIFAARGVKPIVAFANEMAASAAYLIASAAESIVVTATGLVGSIGTLWIHEDWSKANEADGVKVTTIRAGRWKALQQPHEPLSEDAQQQMQALVDEYYRLFIAAVARGREMTAEAVRDRIGEGREFVGAQAVAVGAADRVSTLADVVEQLNRGTFFGGKAMAQGTTAAAEFLKNLEAEDGAVEPAVEAKPVETKASDKPAEGVAPKGDLIAPDAKAAERERINEIDALIDISRLPAQEAKRLRQQLVDSDATVADARRTLAAAVRQHDQAIGTPPTVDAKTDPDAAFKAEYAQYAARGKSLGVSEAEYVASRRIDAGTDTLSLLPQKA